MAGAAGLPPAAALDLTLFELSAWHQGRMDAAREQMQVAGWAAWCVASLSRAQKIPPLKKWLAQLRDGPGASTRHSVGDVIAAMRMDALAQGLPSPKPRKMK